MKSVVALSNGERAELFQQAAVQKGITPAAMEKDFWLCWALKIIFEHERLSQLLRFKGGTSLSKCFGAIDRFSEDIDLILDWTHLTADDLHAPRSGSQQDKLNKKINQVAVQFIADEILPIIKKALTPVCGAVLDATDAHIINITYPASFSDPYQRHEVSLEIGPLASMMPAGEFLVTPYAAEIFPKIFTEPTTKVTAIRPERTFWEKVTILHAEAHRPVNKLQPSRYSRHYYDVYRLLSTDIAQRALGDMSLLENVVEFKKRFYPAAWANYDAAKPGSFKLVPSDVALENLKRDYANMRQMIFGEYPDFDVILSNIKTLQDKINLR